MKYHVIHQNAQAEALEQKIKDEPAFPAVLAIFNDIYSKVLKRETHEVKHDWRLRSDLERNVRRLEINAKKFLFLRSVAETNIEVLDKVLSEYTNEQKKDNAQCTTAKRTSS